MRRLRIRHALAAIGAAITLLTLLADRVGIGSGTADVGPGQIAVLAAGIAMTVAGALGRRAAVVYRAVAILLLNTIAILVLIELVAIPLFRLEWNETKQPGSQPFPPAVARFKAEESRVKLRYSPLETWRAEPFDGELLHVDERGFREVPGTECQRESYRIFTFGGSTMWGWGVDDSGTIPAHLQRALQSAAPRPVCIVNMGYNAFVSTQELARFIRQLQRGDRPDLVIFYDGFNDVYAGHVNGWAGDHLNVAQIAQKLEGPPAQQQLRNGVVDWLLSSYTYRVYWDLVVLPRLPPNLPHEEPERRLDTLPQEILAVYLNNYRMIRALAQANGAEAFFFWQPTLAAGRKPLTAEERRLWSQVSKNRGDLTRIVYARMRQDAGKYERLYFLGDVFEQEKGEIYFDEVHINARGNAIVAERMAREITEALGWRTGNLHAQGDRPGGSSHAERGGT